MITHFHFQDITTDVIDLYGPSDQEAVQKKLRMEEVQQYLSECARLAWRMVLQRPPMSFDSTHDRKSWKNNGLLELMWGSNPNAPGAVIQYYKCPVLIHGDKTMAKGSVLVHS